MECDGETLLVVGSVAYDSVRTPAGSRTDALGGSAMYFSLASSRFAPVAVVAVVGEDFREEDAELMRSRGVDLAGLERRAGRTFRWSGVYDAEDSNTRETLDTQLNVFADFRPDLAPAHSGAGYLFLANIQPGLQLRVLEQMRARPRLVALDSMNFWIEGSRDDLARVVGRSDIVIVDESEARQFAGEANLVAAAEAVLRLGPRAVVIKRGEHGSLTYLKGETGAGAAFACPALPLRRVVDPTGAGDSFAGGLMGYLAATGAAADSLGAGELRRAVAVGTVMGSITVQGFSAENLAAASAADIRQRFDRLLDLVRIERPRSGNGLPIRRGA